MDEQISIPNRAMMEYINKAILIERERCAKIAEAFGDNGPGKEDDSHWTRGDEIAFQIMNPGIVRV